MQISTKFLKHVWFLLAIIIVLLPIAGSIPSVSAQTGNEVPVIDIWYGSQQRFGQLGSPQPWVNILGNVSDADDVSSLTYSLNGGPEIVLSIGPDSKRLLKLGDFNIDLHQDDLINGLNQVVITATDSLSNTATENVTVEYAAGNTWPLPYSIEWSTVNDIQDVAQAVDGLWEIEGGEIGPTFLGYDRLIAIGDVSWEDYEVQVPITIHALRGGLVGIGLHWNGHTDDPVSGWQPKSGYVPLGALGVYSMKWDSSRNNLGIMGGDGGFVARDSSGKKLDADVTYIFKMRVQTTEDRRGDLVPLYSFKVWEEGQPEPAVWDLTAEEGPEDSQHGSVLLVSHQIDASFGNVVITPLADTTNPVISNINVVPSETTATITWATNEPATSQVAFGPTSAYENGTVNDSTLVTQHSITLSGLAAQSLYHYQISSNDESGNTTSSQDAVFSTSGGGSTTHTLTVNTVGSGTVGANPEQTTYTEGQTVELTATADAGWVFDGWSGDVTGSANPATVTMDSDKVVTATFVETGAASYGLTVNTVGSGTVGANPEQTTYTEGQTVELTATADAGWVFDGWSGDVTGSTNPATVTMDSDKVVTATFVADVTQPIISNVQVTSGTTNAVVTWTTDEPATSSVAYGPSAAYENGTVEDLALVTEHSITLTGLSANSLYHYQVRSTDGSSNEAVGADGTFTTQDVTDPSGIVSDDFNSCLLNEGLWSLVDPVGDASLSMNGTQALLSVPAGVSHDVWSAGNMAPRLMQAAADTDFEVEVKFESTVDAAYQLQGILVEADAGNFLRFDFFSDGSSTRIFAAKFENGRPRLIVNEVIGGAGTAPLYMRVTRVGDQWTQAYSLDGENWTVAADGYTHALAVTGVGVFVGNGGGALPAHTGVIDYFFNTASPIIPEDANGNTLAVNVSGSGSVAQVPDQATYACGEVVELTATADPGWVFNGWSGDVTGSTNPATVTMDSDRVVTATFVETGAASYGLTVNTVGSGTVGANPEQTTYNEGQTVELTATADAGWVFNGWSGDVTGSTNPATVTMDSDKVVTATFVETVPDTYGLTVNTVGSGTVGANPEQVTYTEGQTVELTATADAGWVFDGWSGDVTGSTNPATVTMDSDKVVTATFVADVTQPIISNVQVTSGTTNAVVTWTTDEPATSSVAYGPSAAYENGTVDNLALVTEHSITLTGLSANSLYHYQVRSVDGGGNEAVGADGIFTTQDVTDPSGIVSDDFNSCLLNEGLWSLVDPVGDASLSMNGTQALLSVPAGVSHDVWSAGNMAPRLMQAAADTDFEVEVKFESTVDAAYQLQGILVEADAGNFLRFDFFSDGSSTRIFAAKFENGRPRLIVNEVIGGAGTAPLYMRVTRVGDQWTQAYSLDGENWTVAADGYTHALAVTGVGVFVGNGGGALPAHTGVIDYFFNTASPIIPEDANGNTLAVNVSGSGSVAQVPDQATYACGEVVELTATADPGWVFNGWSGDVTGSTNPATVTMDSDRVVTATFVETGAASYGLTVNTVGSGTVGANPEQTTYNEGQTVELTATADAGWVFNGWSGDVTGSTNPATVTMDSDKVVTATFVETVPDTYGLTVNTVGSGTVGANPEQVTYTEGQTVELTATADAGWVFDGWSGDVTGSTNPATVTMDSDKVVTATFVADVTQPIISNVQVTSGTTNAVVTWTTDEPATSSVAYGPSAAYENGTVDNLALVTEHSITLTGLSANSLYHYQVRSVDGGGNEAVGADGTFTTQDVTDPSGIVSDDFNSCLLNEGLWSLVDPVGDASLSMNGTQALLSVPAGVSHDVWSAGNMAPRLMQAAADTDFEVEVKFESTVDAAYQLQGILVEADAGNFLRFDFFSDGSSTRIFAAKFENGRPRLIVNEVIGGAGTAPLYMRVTRVGDQWTQAYSLDGENWTVAADGYTHALAVTGVGVFVGNGGGALPAHTGAIDYFFNTASPIIPEDLNSVTCN